MATSPKKDSKTPKGAAANAQVGYEFGVGSVFPSAPTWEDFVFNNQYAGATGGNFISNRPDAVPMEKLMEMLRRDGQTRSLLRLFMLPILSCVATGKWIKDPDATYEGGDEEVDFANQMFSLPPQAGGMSASLTKVMRQTLMAALFGFAVFEEVRQIPEEGPLKGKITLRKLAYRHPRTIRFRVDAQGGFDGVKQTAKDGKGLAKEVVLEKEKVWYYCMHDEENPFYGVSMFESAWYHYEIKTRLYFIHNIAAQFAAVSGRIGKYPQSATKEQREGFDRALKSFAFNTSLMVPAGFEVTPFNSNTGFDFLKGIEHHQHMQAKSVLMQFADTENRMVLIDNGSADASADMFVQSLVSVMDEISESWSVHLLPKYIDWNFGSGKYPVWRFGELTDAHKDSIKDIFMTVVTSSVLNSTPDFVREMEKTLAERLGLDIDYAKIEAAEKAAAEQQAAQEQALNSAPPEGEEEETAEAPQSGAEQVSIPPSEDAAAEAPTGGAATLDEALGLSAEDWSKLVRLADSIFNPEDE